MKPCSIQRARLIQSLAVFAFVALSISNLHAQDVKLGALRIVHPFTRATPLAGANAIGYLRIDTSGHNDDTLLGASSSDAVHVEIHQMSMSGGIMHMRALTEGLAIPAGGSVDLGPDSASGDHLMLIGVKRQLQPGDVLPVTLHFAKAGDVVVGFIVQAIGTAESP